MNQDPKDEESPTEYVRGGYLPVSFGDSFCDGKYVVVRKLGCVSPTKTIGKPRFLTIR
jgi:hypothetical protein